VRCADYRAAEFGEAPRASPAGVGYAATPAMGLTARLAEFAARSTLDDFPPAAVVTAKAGTVDCLGVMLAGSPEPVAGILVDLACTLGGAPRATVIGHGCKTSVSQAAMINGAIGHALDYDDSTRRSGPIVITRFGIVTTDFGMVITGPFRDRDQRFRDGDHPFRDGDH
jgi:hypothetical protein